MLDPFRAESEFPQINLTQTNRDQTRITDDKNKRLAHRLLAYGFIGIGIGIERDFLNPIADETFFIAKR